MSLFARSLALGTLAAALAMSPAARAQHAGHGAHGSHHARSGPAAAQPYAGQDARAVSTLSDADIAELTAGRGWGLAKPAELNGYPGPAHVLELADKLELTESQRRQVKAVHDRMQVRAAAAGRAFVEAERDLDRAFEAGRATPDTLRALVASAETKRTATRLAHLEAHLETTPILTETQRRRYAELRGYASPSHSQPR